LVNKSGYTTYSLNYAIWTGTDWNKQTIGEGKPDSFALDSNGNCHITFTSYENSTTVLKYAFLDTSSYITAFMIPYHIIIGAAVAAIVMLTIYIIRKRKKTIAQSLMDDF
jgi:hypothetical protein